MSDQLSKRYFHFTIGPVQGFVAQARRTRDFWAGSFILSWLAAVAMRAVQKQRGEILFPKPDDSFMGALEIGGDKGPKQGNVPNRFKARVGGDFDPHLVSGAARAAWWELAEHIRQADLATESEITQTIWRTQISQFWEVQWALVDDEGVANTLDRLKNWRTHLTPDQPGVKCMMMDGWQELSGADRPGAEVDAFWKRVRSKGSKGMKTDLREGEALCAMAFVKRRFARHFPSFTAFLPGGWKLTGWKLPVNVPSVHYLAAAPWLSKLFEKAEDPEVANAFWDFHDAASSLVEGEYSEWDSNIRCVQKSDVNKRWKALDGSVLFEAMLENHRLWDEKAADAKKLIPVLRRVQKLGAMDPVSPFYAVLLMDGDQLGIHMSTVSKQPLITVGLARFTEKVPDLVNDHNGFLVYAGGDDVLALLPLEDALRCAHALRNHYLSCFEGTGIPSTLSGAIEYAHIKMPLTKVLRDAHDLLDNLAKEARGRDTIACRVWKPGGLAVEWAMPWECAVVDGELVVERLASEFQASMSEAGRDLANGFFYRIRERFDLLNPANSNTQGVLGESEQLDLMAMEYLNSGLVRNLMLGMPYARSRISDLLSQCRPKQRKRVASTVQYDASSRLEADGALLVRFLALKGVER